MTAAKFNVGDLALDRVGRVVKIRNLVYEGDVEFAWVTYPNGDGPIVVGGRVSGTEEDPLWEHRVEDGEVVASNADYYNPDAWTTEKGLRPLPELLLNASYHCSACKRTHNTSSKIGRAHTFFATANADREREAAAPESTTQRGQKKEAKMARKNSTEKATSSRKSEPKAEETPKVEETPAAEQASPEALTEALTEALLSAVREQVGDVEVVASPDGSYRRVRQGKATLAYVFPRSRKTAVRIEIPTELRPRGIEVTNRGRLALTVEGEPKAKEVEKVATTIASAKDAAAKAETETVQV